MTWVAANTRKKQSGATVSGWSRPSDWPALPTINNGDQKFVGIYAVFNHDSNFVALSATDAYTVDWGDGSAPENVASGVQVNHAYDYATVQSQVTSRGYKTCVVTVTPQSGNLTGLNLSKKHVQTGLSNYSTGWLEIAIGGVFSSTGLVIGMTNTVLHRMLESIVSLFNTSAVTNMSYMFYNCSSLQSIPLFNTSAVKNMSGMFQGCSSLQSIPLFNTSAVTNMSYMFYNCSSLQSIPLFNTLAVTDMSYMFQGCTSLQSIPLFNTSAVTNMYNMFYNCSSLQSIPLFNTSAVTNMSGMFQGCSSLQSIPLFNTSAVTNMSGMFQGCSSLQSIPLFNTSAVTNMSGMFSSCYSISTAAMANVKVSVSISGGKMSKSSIVAVFNNLSTATAQTVTVSGNWGYELLTTTDREIATNKGWTIA